MIISRRTVVAAMLAASLCITACHRDQPATLSAAALRRAQDQLSQPAWLRAHLPASTVGYIRIASPWGLFGAVPNGRPLDAVMAGDQNLKAVAALREALAKDKVLADAGATPYLLPLLADLRSPLELALIDPIGTPSPNTQLLISVRIAQTSVAELNARFAQIEAPTLKLSAPLDGQGNGRLANGTSLHFDVASGRLFALASRQPIDPARLAALIGDATNAKPDSELAKTISAQEQQVDQSGQGTFAWISVRGLGGVAAGAIPSQAAGTLPGDLTSKTQSIAFGAGTVDGHARLRIVVHAPQSRLLGYLAPTRFAPDFKLAGAPRWVVNFALPGADQFKAFENNLSLDFGPDRATSVRNAEGTIQQKLGFSLADLTRWIGPELIGFEDDAGVYTAVRVNDRKALYDHLQALAQRQNGSYRTQSVDGVDVHMLSFGHTAATAAASASPRQRAWATLGTRFGTHLYWIEDGDFLIFARVPQALADRHAAKLDTSLDAWLKTQAWRGDESLLGFTTVSHDAQRDAYYGYLQVLQLLGDLSGQPMNLSSMPAAHSLNLPRQGVIGMSLGVTASDLSLNLAYEQQPSEMLTGGGGGSMTAVAAVAIMAAIAVPAYQDYTIKAQVSEGVTLAGPAKTLLDRYHQQHRHWPTDNQQAGLSSPEAIKGRYVDSVTVKANGEIQAHFSATAPSQANRQLDGKSLLFTPDGDQWRCHSDDIVDKYLPADCKH